MARTYRTPFVVLGILGILDRKPLSGYDIKQLIDGTISHFWSESLGQIYPVLKRLAADKLIRARAMTQNGRKKVVYAITAKGKQSLRSWLEKPPEQGPKRDELILKLFFGSQTEVPVLIGHLQGYRDRVKPMLQQYTDGLKLIEKQNESYTPYQLITLRGGIAMCKAFVEWADESLATLERMNKGSR